MNPVYKLNKDLIKIINDINKARYTTNPLNSKRVELGKLCNWITQQLAFQASEWENGKKN